MLTALDHNVAVKTNTIYFSRFQNQNPWIAWLLSPIFGGTCGAASAFGSGAWAIGAQIGTGIGAFFGLCLAYQLHGFFQRGHRLWQAFAFVLLPSLMTAYLWSLAGEGLGIVLSLIFSVTLYATLAQLLEAAPTTPYGTCHNCGYDLTGLNASRCPECGSR